MWFTLECSEGCENLPSLPEQAGESSAERCSDGEPSAPSKSRSIREAFSYNGSETESSNRSQSGTMFAPSTADRGAGRSMSSAEVSPVRTSARPGKDSALSEESGADCGESTPGSFAMFDLATASWKTHQCSLFGGLESFSGTWPRSGMMLRGRCYQLATAAHRMNGRGCGLSEKIPTPQSRDSNKGYANRVGRDFTNLCDWATKFPTPTTKDYVSPSPNEKPRDRLVFAIEKGITKSHKFATQQSRDFRTANGKQDRWSNPKRSRNLNDQVHFLGNGNGGKLNPDWVEWLMGWPIGWTASRPLGTDKFRLWRQGRFVI